MKEPAPTWVKIPKFVGHYQSSRFAGLSSGRLFTKSRSPKKSKLARGSGRQPGARYTVAASRASIILALNLDFRCASLRLYAVVRFGGLTRNIGELIFERPQ